MTLFFIGETEIRINLSFVFCIVVWVLGKNLVALFVLALVVLLHELAHAFAARLLQKRTKSIELFPFGASAQIEGIEDFASQEIIIALAGPMFSLLCGFVCTELIKTVPIPFAEEFIKYSYAVATFNFIPAYPLDGGRVLKCLLSSVLKNGRKISLLISVGISLMLCAYSIYQILRGQSGSFLVMGVFVLVAAIKALKTPSNAFCRDKIIKNSKSVCVLKAFYDESVLSVHQRLMGNKYNVVLVLDKLGRTVKMVDEIELAQAVMQDPLKTVGKMKKDL